MFRSCIPFRRHLAPAVRQLAYQLGISTLLSGRAPHPRILMYHGVESDAAPAFAKQMEFVSRHCSIVPLDVLLSGYAAGTSRNELALTFDDGLRNNRTVVYPILERLRLPATFFVCPGNISSGQWIWTYDTLERLQQLPLVERLSIAAAISAPNAGAEEFLGFLKLLPCSTRLVVQTQIRTRTIHYRSSPAQRERFDVMNWDEVASLDPALITIGSHTMSHPNLTTLTREELAFEVQESRRVLEERLGREINYFSYPDGFHDKTVVEFVRGVYRGAVTVRWGTLGYRDDLHQLPRIPADPADVPLFAWRLHSA
jgi:peptidoglycan/xylan/chitin deacetylase (PgdA/CDA1 family)